MAGMLPGLHHPIGMVSASLLLCLSVVLGTGVLFLIQVKMNASPFSSPLDKLYKILLCYVVGCFGALYASHTLQDMEPVISPQAQTFSAVLLEPIQEKAKTYAAKVRVEDAKHCMLLYIAKDARSLQLQAGDFIRVNAQPQLPQEYLDDFNYRNYLKTKDIVLTAYVRPENWETGKPFDLPCSTRLRIRAMLLRESLCQRLEKLIPQANHRALAEAMLLGNRTELSPAQKEAYSMTGISHLLALSGMHIAFLILLLNGMFWWCPKKLKKVLTLLGTWAFILLVGLPTSAVRAGFMLTCLLLNPFPNQHTMPFDRLCLSVLLMVLINPLYLLDVGFQLSVAAVAGIILFQPFFVEVGYIPGFLQNGVKICLCAQLAVLPLSLYHFHTLPLYFLLSNVLVSLILTPLILYLSAAVLLLGDLPHAGRELCLLLEKLLGIQESTVNFLQHLPGAQFTCESFHLGALLCSYTLLLLLLNYLIQRDSRSIILCQLATLAILTCLLLGI